MNPEEIDARKNCISRSEDHTQLKPFVNKSRNFIHHILLQSCRSSLRLFRRLKELWARECCMVASKNFDVSQSKFVFHRPKSQKCSLRIV